ncbi:hypothetical protein G7K_0517-t1 [Saitoella complicata NRRL Y-17804]|uniref:Uncharacterized protein n=1 Tax=Saitoella complicata (strain BCRC 22490 / CBS 7301 / JCM 7358 / NBRC 10748 / NRRL Y-17804) TaxID=698492 RepID=A0A0E9N8Y7_SAICN|nr:hypothetical protein G7K_0517-t1 [Saitoella complicata NRRL Y-17804]
MSYIPEYGALTGLKHWEVQRISLTREKEDPGPQRYSLHNAKPNNQNRAFVPFLLLRITQIREVHLVSHLIRRQVVHPLHNLCLRLALRPVPVLARLLRLQTRSDLVGRHERLVLINDRTTKQTLQNADNRHDETGTNLQQGKLAGVTTPSLRLGILFRRPRITAGEMVEPTGM